ncbi:MAG: methyltransferase domain-containing protein [Helicobacteraceae bacterium]|nr:methyltransferase domain-containing protein [Helicobacteraceae bacterium]
MPRIDNDEFYSATLKKHTLNHRKVHWNSLHSQHTRFRVLLKLLNRDLSQDAIVDAGCGLADLLTYLNTERIRVKKYIGLDLHRDMIMQARELHNNQEILQLDILNESLPTAEWYFCSGAMNVLTRDETHKFITKCFNSSSKGFVFNILKGRDQSLVYNYFLPQEIKKLSLELGAKVKFVEGYLERDFSVLMYKEPKE